MPLREQYQASTINALSLVQIYKGTATFTSIPVIGMQTQIASQIPFESAVALGISRGND
jgi:hypothetical protein